MTLRSALPGCTLVTAAIVVSMSGTAGAKSAIASTIAAQTDAPVRIDSCTIGSGIDASDAEHLTEYVTFTNIVPKTVKAVKFRFELLDAAGGTLLEATSNLNGAYRQNDRIKPRISFDTPVPNALDSVRCSVAGVLFDDDSIWQPAEPKASPTVFATPTTKP